MSMTATAPARLLIVDDVEDNRAVLGRRFASRGYDVVEADNALSALELIAKHDFDLVLLDIMMPGMDGIQALKQIRLTHSPDDLPVIMVTARARVADIVEALDLGANDYITKPVEFSIALARANTQLARKRAQQALELSIKELRAINRQLEIEIFDRQQSDARFNYLAYHDALTGLGNLAMFRERLARELRRKEPDRGHAAVIMLDIEGFKLINDTMGLSVGDVLLADVAERLRGFVRESDAVARTGSDEFAILLTGLEKPEDAGVLADKIADAIATPQIVGGQRLMLEVSVGIAIAASDGNEPDLLLGNASLALEGAKGEGRAARRFFEPGMNVRAKARRVLKSDLLKALQAGEFELFYQPLFNLAGQAVTGYEALLRWRHPVRGLVSPADFIPLTEEIGLIVPLGAWVLRQACLDAARWPDHMKVAVNISSVQFRHPGLVEAVISALAASSIAASRLELEITETVLLNEDDGTLGALHRLRDIGVHISLDDFGTGYSSLSYLRMFPFDKIKIDQSFVRNLDTDASAKPIVKAITGLARNLGIDTTAEGVETQEQLDWLQAQGCNEVQGFLISRPMPVKDIAFSVADPRALRVA